MKKQKDIVAEIKNILVHLACEDELPIDMNDFDPALLLPAFYKGKNRYLVVNWSKRGGGTREKVYDTKEKKYIS